MKTKLMKTTVRGALAGAAMLLAIVGASAQPPPKNPATIQGVWRVTRHGVNCQTGQQLNSFPFIMSFNQDGTMTGYGVAPFSGPFDGPEYGVWAPKGSDYSFRDLSYGYDPDTGAFQGSGEVIAIVHMTSANTFTYTASICVYDAVGNQLFCFCGQAEGTRF